MKRTLALRNLGFGLCLALVALVGTPASSRCRDGALFCTRVHVESVEDLKKYADVPKNGYEETVFVGKVLKVGEPEAASDDATRGANPPVVGQTFRFAISKHIFSGLRPGLDLDSVVGMRCMEEGKTPIPPVYDFIFYGKLVASGQVSSSCEGVVRRGYPVSRVADAPACPDGIGASAGDVPKLLLRIDTKRAVIVCGWSNKRDSGTTVGMSEFDVWAFESGAKVDRLFTALARDNYRVTVMPAEKTIRLQSLLDLAAKGPETKIERLVQVPFLETKIDCTGPACLVRNTSCVLKVVKDRVFPGIGAAVREKLKKEKTLEFLDDGPGLYLEKLLGTALSEDADAQRVLIDLEKDQRLDGHVAERVAAALQAFHTANQSCGVQTHWPGAGLTEEQVHAAESPNAAPGERPGTRQPRLGDFNLNGNVPVKY